MTRSRWRALLALTLAFGLTAGLAACGGDDDGPAASDTVEGPTIRIAPQDFNEAKTLTQVYAQYLTAKGFKVEVQPARGFRDQVYPALEGGRLDLIVDYTGSGAGFLDPDASRTADPDEAHAALESALAARDLVAGAYSPAASQNALVALKSWADDHDLTTISGLKALGTVRLGADEDCRERPDCFVGYTDPAIYGLSLHFTALSYGSALTAALEQGTVHVAQYATTAPEIASGDFVVLEDDLGLLSADNIVPVLRKEIADAYDGDLIAALDELSEKLTTEVLIGWNERTEVDKEEPADVAKAWLEDQGLI